MLSLSEMFFFYISSVLVCSGTSLSAEVDEVKMEDGTKMQPVSVIFPDGHSIPAQQQHQVQPCTMKKACRTKTVVLSLMSHCLKAFCKNLYCI